MTQQPPAWHACAALVERGDHERFRAGMAAPVAARAVLFPIYAMGLEVARAPWLTQEPMIAEMRLQWWRDVLAEIKSGQDVRKHEVTTPLAQVLTQAGCDALDDLIEARRWDIYKEAFEDEAALSLYLERSAGGLLFACADALGQSDVQLCKDAGYAAGLARFLQAVPQLEAHNRIPLLDGREDAVARLAQGGLDRLKAARAHRGNVATAPLLSCWTAEPILIQAAENPGRVAQGTLLISDWASARRLMWQATTGRW